MRMNQSSAIDRWSVRPFSPTLADGPRRREALPLPRDGRPAAQGALPEGLLPGAAGRLLQRQPRRRRCDIRQARSWTNYDSIRGAIAHSQRGAVLKNSFSSDDAVNKYFSIEELLLGLGRLLFQPLGEHLLFLLQRHKSLARSNSSRSNCSRPAWKRGHTNTRLW